MKKGYVIGAIIIFATVLWVFDSFKSSLTAYVKIDEARLSRNPVQVAGAIVPQSKKFNTKKTLIEFTIIDENGDELLIHYKGVKPANFENAERVVVTGKYDTPTKTFIARELLVKCPTKYQGKNIDDD